MNRMNGMPFENAGCHINAKTHQPCQTLRVMIGVWIGKVGTVSEELRWNSAHKQHGCWRCGVENAKDFLFFFFVLFIRKNRFFMPFYFLHLE